MRTRNGSRNSNPLVCSFTQNVCTIRGNRTAKKVGVDQNWKFTLWFVSYTCWKSQDFPTPPIQEKRENILQLNIIEYYSLFDFENSISANCIEGTLQFAWRTEGMKKKRKGFQKQFIFNLEIYLHLPDVGTTLVQYFFFFFWDRGALFQFKLIFCLIVS